MRPLKVSNVKNSGLATLLVLIVVVASFTLAVLRTQASPSVSEEEARGLFEKIGCVSCHRQGGIGDSWEEIVEGLRVAGEKYASPDEYVKAEVSKNVMEKLGQKVSTWQDLMRVMSGFVGKQPDSPEVEAISSFFLSFFQPQQQTQTESPTETATMTSEETVKATVTQQPTTPKETTKASTTPTTEQQKPSTTTEKATQPVQATSTVAKEARGKGLGFTVAVGVAIIVVALIVAAVLLRRGGGS